MTIKVELFDKQAVCSVEHVGGPEPVTMNDGSVVDPLYIYLNDGAPPDRAYLEVSGDYFCEINGEGIYEEKLNMYEAGTHWAELQVIRFNMWTSHPKLGDISIQIDESRAGSRASIRSINADTKYPIWNRARFFITATASAMPGVILQNRGAPLFLHSDALMQWPPRDALYRFDVRVPLERRDRPGDIVATINPGAMLIGQTV